VRKTPAIEELMAAADQVGLGGVRTHIQDALRCLGARPEPDYRNAVKEAISAVESAVRAITHEERGHVQKALKMLEQEVPIHP
jgi:hypothetical protein